MDNDTKKQLLALKLELLSMLNNGTFQIHPQDVLNKVNYILENAKCL